MSEKCTVLYRAAAPTDIKGTALKIIDDVLTLQAAVGSMHAARTETEQALCRIQRQARALLGVSEEPPSAYRLDGLVELVTRLERGEEVRHNLLRQTLVTLDVASAKIKRYLEATHGGVVQPAA
ncbi:MAG: hypothetical protein AB1413_12525 [Thermodesulfobacteriota bacterium]